MRPRRGAGGGAHARESPAAVPVTRWGKHRVHRLRKTPASGARGPRLRPASKPRQLVASRASKRPLTASRASMRGHVLASWAGKRPLTASRASMRGHVLASWAKEARQAGARWRTEPLRHSRRRCARGWLLHVSLPRRRLSQRRALMRSCRWRAPRQLWRWGAASRSCLTTARMKMTVCPLVCRLWFPQPLRRQQTACNEGI